MSVPTEASLNEFVSLLGNWRFYIIFLPSTFLCSGAGAYVGSRFKKKGEIDAVDANLEKILCQLEETTKVADQVRSKVDHADWVTREWKTIRRVKLEELVQSAISVRHWTNKDLSLDRQDRQNAKSESCPAYHVVMIARLYFPEIQNESEQLVEAVGDAQAWQISKAIEISSQSRDEQKKQRANPWFDSKTILERNEQVKGILKAIKAVEEKAGEIMCDMQKS